MLLVTPAPIPIEEDGKHKEYSLGWHDGPNDGIPPGFKAILEKLGKYKFEEDGKHKEYTYGWSDGPNDGIPPGFQQLLDKALADNPELKAQFEAANKKKE